MPVRPTETPPYGILAQAAKRLGVKITSKCKCPWHLAVKKAQKKPPVQVPQ